MNTYTSFKEQLEVNNKMEHPLTKYFSFIDELRSGHIYEDPSPVPNVLVEFLVDFISEGQSLDEDEKEELNFFIFRVVRRTQVSISAIIMTIYYVNQLYQKTNGKLFSDYFGKAEFYVGMILADKYLFDQALANIVWAQVSRIFSLDDVNLLEREALKILEFNLVVQQHDYDALMSEVYEAISIKLNIQPVSPQLSMNKGFTDISSSPSSSSSSDNEDELEASKENVSKLIQEAIETDSEEENTSQEEDKDMNENGDIIQESTEVHQSLMTPTSEEETQNDCKECKIENEKEQQEEEDTFESNTKLDDREVKRRNIETIAAFMAEYWSNSFDFCLGKLVRVWEKCQKQAPPPKFNMARRLSRTFSSSLTNAI